ncbi:expression site-associated gene (ESAG) protein, putative; expression site-associated gene 1 (ESAG1) protein, putative [Trypanosoma brucei brucei TREU927]|uniref:Expression site-associated gene (ESAG) protein, putative expression site-associated gene 1 (ESAG1) protein, putative n=1 Tax=Trypanosoma brucei brucei (strain 927/4 GUTat10.1) TaxID=185431 RepID=Q4GY69_TRYB2|nr:expression site-associated gene (ESAG) protein; expression site-associated gene 1 (ESAG1) [Trypanosoma brucei brucei TREU927]CAJ16718.1 expression site-associated gene (ESAG) protein, putative; expression site-associated gene 1 (ESAG1) protein, putative [Trypanosoma brucei brucei TREU927]
MKVTIAELVVLLFSVICIDGKEENGCTLITDYHGDAPLSESVCYLSCLSDALNKLYADGENKLFVNEEVYANAFRILDDMEGRTGESVRYLSIISGVMEGKHDKLKKLISYGNAMGDLVAKAGGLFAEVNESVRAVRKEIPGALIKVNKYYTAIAVITRTVWDDVEALERDSDPNCHGEKIKNVGEFQVTCGEHFCPLKEGVNESTLQKYKDGCLEINVQDKSGQISECLNLPRNSLYKNGAVKYSSDGTNWYGNGNTYFQLKLHVHSMLSPLTIPLGAGQPPSAPLDMMASITSLYSRFNEIHKNFTSLLLNTNFTGIVNSSNSDF